jgi:putative ABC transport system permease protein
MYFPLLSGEFPFVTLIVRATDDPNLVSLPVQKEMRNLEPDLPAVTVRSMDEMMFGSTQQNRFGLTLIALFAGLAVILASVGLYGVLAYSVGQRTGEFGVRIALGADTPKIARLILWQGMKPTIAGIVLGLAGSLATTRLVQTMLYDVKPSDPIVVVSVVVLLVMIALAACFVPAWRATRIDPVAALRAE